MATFNIGDVIHDKYQLTAELGQGGIGIVYAARRLDGDELVALKFLLPPHSESPKAAARFRDEALASMRLKSDHVARVLDVGTFRGVPFMVIERLDGKDLATILREGRGLSVAEAVDLVLQACEAVNEAHTLGVAHRNVKPGNVFVTKTPDGLATVKVVDFGLEQWSIADDASIRVSVATVGSPRYVSPEQLVAPWRPDPSSDVWSLGVIFYEMLAGRPAFASDKALLSGTYAELSSLRADVPAAIDEILSEAFARDPSARLSTVVALSGRLAPFGSDAARVLHDRIDAQKAPALPARADAVALPTSKTRATPAPAPVMPAAERPTQAMLTSRGRRWARGAVVGALGVVAVGGAVLTWFPGLRNSREAATVEERLAALNARCDGGEPAACESLVVLYAQGEGMDIPVDGVRRLVYERKACKLGSAYSCSVAKLEYELMDAETTIALNNMLLQKVCDTGSMEACELLGDHWLIGLGDGERRMRAVGKALIERACQGGRESACVKLAGLR